MQDFVPKTIIDVKDLFSMVLDARKRHGIEGISLIGGEPFLQAETLAHLAEKCHTMGLTTAAFTGYLYEELLSSDLPGAGTLLSELDLLIDGPYKREEPEKVRNWAGSRNQRFHYLTGAYDQSIENRPESDGLEIIIDHRGQISINGSPSFLSRLTLEDLASYPAVPPESNP